MSAFKKKKPTIYNNLLFDHSLYTCGQFVKCFTMIVLQYLCESNETDKVLTRLLAPVRRLLTRLWAHI